jgi:transcriptional regulator with XRE-family HTH domain
MNPVAMTFGNNLRYCRRRAKLSQEELGYLASLHRTEIGLLERGARVPRIDTLVKLAGGLSIAPEELLTDIAWNPGSTQLGSFVLSDPQEEAPEF